MFCTLSVAVCLVWSRLNDLQGWSMVVRYLQCKPKMKLVKQKHFNVQTISFHQCTFKLKQNVTNMTDPALCLEPVMLTWTPVHKAKQKRVLTLLLFLAINMLVNQLLHSTILLGRARTIHWHHLTPTLVHTHTHTHTHKNTHACMHAHPEMLFSSSTFYQ